MFQITLIHAPRNEFGKPGKSGQARGIHLLDPTLSELQDALETAERDGFAVIYAHARMPSKGVSGFIKSLLDQDIHIGGSCREYVISYFGMQQEVL
jgi:hypothetical protein